ncbi:unnamed protein product [Pedinophyceae sp. YPF-701]|nr:unnamed protein product [Pedinophyceae sp. YPF-701]
MVQPWWALAGLPLVFIGRGRGRGGDKAADRANDNGPPTLVSSKEDGGEANFVCERVCTSNRLLKKLGGLAKDPTPNTCVTVCGVSATDSCTEACQRAVCTGAHHVPQWNDLCLRRCQDQCLKGRTSGV